MKHKGALQSISEVHGCDQGIQMPAHIHGDMHLTALLFNKTCGLEHH